ncbi:TonB-dependent receptor [Verrucomicrobiota bacterium]|nr:TonB-dependent receptor [Verrucomicrobiota bacterium]
MTTLTVATNFSATTRRLCAAVMLAGALAASGQQSPAPAAAPANTNAAPAAATPAVATPATPAAPDGKKFDLADELRWLKAERMIITSVSKRPEVLFEAPAAVAVITNDDIRRSGARSFPEALRLVPGMSVAQADANSWAVSARGNNNIFADKMLVLVDGRTIFQPVFNGVFWNVQDYVLEDIERIEVIRGPGGTLWGANAVNGVINIITKEAKETPGVFVNAGGGTMERGFFSARYGAKVGEDAFARGYFNFRERAPREGGHDSSTMVQGGFRTDWKVTDVARLTLQGDAYAERHDNRLAIPNFVGPNFFPLTDQTYRNYGGNILSRYTREFGPESELQIQAYYDRNDRHELGIVARQDILDFDIQHRFPLGERQTVVAGAGYRYFPDVQPDNAVFIYDRRELNSQLFSAFLQDEIGFFDDHVKLTLGSKVEHNDRTGFEVQPNARLVWQPTKKQTIWGAVSRAIQMPGRSITDIRERVALGLQPMPVGDLNGDGSVDYLFFRGGPAANPKSETLLAYELGYRLEVTDRLSFDTAAFYNEYRNVVAGRVGAPFPEFNQNFHLVLPINAVNIGSRQTYGFEVSAKWQAADWWRLSAGYSQLQVEVDAYLQAGRDPVNQVALRSSMDLPGNLELDIMSRYVDVLPPAAPGGPRVNPYFSMDARLGWKASKNVEFALVGQNLLSARHTEFSPEIAVISQTTQVPRSVYATISLRF